MTLFMSLPACFSDTQSFDLSPSQLHFNCNCMFYQNSLTYVPMEGKICNYCSLFTNTHKKNPFCFGKWRKFLKYILKQYLNVMEAKYIIVIYYNRIVQNNTLCYHLNENIISIFSDRVSPYFKHKEINMHQCAVYYKML